MQPKTRLLQGNEACTEGAIAAGARFYAGYPITPSTEIAEYASLKLPAVGGKFVQMEDEIAGMAAIIGASIGGVKSFTATSGPGFSLKQENIGYAIMAEIPCVIVNVQRMGPSTGIATAPAQADVMQARWGTHGDHPVIALAPATVRECYDLTVEAFNISETLRQPVLLMLDEIVGHMRENITLPEPGELIVQDRAKPGDKDSYLPYADSADISPLASFGDGYYYNITGLAHDEKGFPTSDGKKVRKLLDRLHQKIELHMDRIMFFEETHTEDADLIVFAYGSSARPARSAVKRARENGMRVGLFRAITLWPFPEQQVRALADKASHILVPEMNRGQLVNEVERVAGGRAKVSGLHRYDGELFSPEEIYQAIKETIS
jgi:2-oxoglutarate/2-oxoacid ferredoxin oxidoreductase subunit alpha